MASTVDRISDAAVMDATGRDWADWFSFLDGRAAAEVGHKAIVGIVADAGVDNPWWQQTVAVAYEQARDLREVGQTADAGYQVGVQRTVRQDRTTLWDRLVSRAGLALWLGEVSAFDLQPDQRYETSNGTTGDVRSVTSPERLRLTWQPANRSEPTTLQLTLACPRNDDTKTTLRFHHERLADAAERTAMREHWRAVLDRIAASVE